ncbi:hypothetical protein QAD02_004452 [Eretmocerus hayati]|uniref:Uncharacterized protein n=1 Tax=Eretmocerus hayati TaxID=131215 RepID=A0ACC2NPS0_9HYME|nr:hypothetical protein QAD02_004452 [Eretmocerus hayati]
MKRTRKISRASRNAPHPYASSRYPGVTEKFAENDKLLPGDQEFCREDVCTLPGCQKYLEEQGCDQCGLQPGSCECALNLVTRKEVCDSRCTSTSPCYPSSPCASLQSESCVTDCGYDSDNSHRHSSFSADYGYESSNGLPHSPIGVNIFAASASLNAALQRDLDAVNALLLSYRDSVLRSGNGLGPLYFAIKSGHLSMVKLLVVRHGCDVNEDVHNFEKKARCKHLHLAVARNNIQMVQTLLECGADPTARDSSGRTSLHLACHLGLTDIVRMLLEYGAQLDLLDSKGLTAAYLAVWFGHLAAYRLLVQRNSDPNECGPDGTSLLQVSIKHHHLDMTRMLLVLGSHVNSCSNSGATPLHTAILAGNWTAVEWLLSLGAEHGTHLERGKAPLHLAVEAEALVCVKILLRHKADPNVVDDEGNTPLLMAVRLGCEDMVKELLKYGADPSLLDATGSNALHVAASKGFTHLLGILLERGMDLNAVDGLGRTALHIATANELGNFNANYKGSFAVHLLSYGADANLRLPHNGETALHVASRRGLINIVTSLLKFGADVDAVSKSGHTALGLAIRYQHPPCVECLLGFGADCNLQGVGAWAFDNPVCHDSIRLIAEVYIKMNAANIPVESSLLRRAESLVDPKLRQVAEDEVASMRSTSLTNDLRVLDVLRAPKRALSSMIQLREVELFFRSTEQANRFPEYRGLLFGQWLRGYKFTTWYQQASDALVTIARGGMDLLAVDMVLGHLDADEVRNLALAIIPK